MAVIPVKVIILISFILGACCTKIKCTNLSFTCCFVFLGS